MMKLGAPLLPNSCTGTLQEPLLCLELVQEHLLMNHLWNLPGTTVRRVSIDTDTSRVVAPTVVVLVVLQAAIPATPAGMHATQTLKTSETLPKNAWHEIVTCICNVNIWFCLSWHGPLLYIPLGSSSMPGELIEAHASQVSRCMA